MSVKKRSIKISGHATSITLEDDFWNELNFLAKKENLSLNALVSKIDKERETENLSSAIRIHILHTLKQALKKS